MQKTENLSWIVKLLQYAIYATAFVPLVIFSQYISPFHFGKVIIFRSIVEIMAVFYLALVVKDRSYLPRWHVLLSIFAGWALLFGITTITSVNPYLSFWGSLERMGGLWSFLHYLVYFIILISVFKTKEEWVRLLKLTVSVGFLSALYGFGQKTNISFFVGGGDRARIFGTIGNAALFAGYELLSLFLALIIALAEGTPRWQKYFFLGAAVANVVAILMTAVRGSIVGIGVGLLVFCLLYIFNSQSKITKKAAMFAFLVLVLLVGLGLALKNTGFVKNSAYLRRITNYSLTETTVQTRIWAWQAGFKGWKETPKTILLGWGPENFNVPFSKYFNPKFFAGLGAETLFDRAHNMFVEIIVTMGLLTFMIYVGMFVFIYILLWRYTFKHQKIEKTVGIGLISLTTAYIIHNFFIFDTSANFLVFFTVLGFITFLTPRSLATEAKEAQKIPAKFALGPGLQAMIFLLLIGETFLIFETNILPAEANYATTRAIIAGWSGDFSGAVAKYKEALNYDVPGKYDLRNKYAQFMLDYTNDNPIDEKSSAAIQSAIDEEQKNANETKDDYLPYLYISRLNILLGQNDPKSSYNDKAFESATKALQISPTFVRTYYEVAQVYLNKGDVDNGLKYFIQAKDLNPNVALTYWYIGATYAQKGDMPNALKYIAEARARGYGFSEMDLRRALTIYLKINDFQSIKWIYESLVRLVPKSAQYHASLAATYAKLGDKDGAIREAQVAGQLDKNFAAEAEAFIKSLGK